MQYQLVLDFFNLEDIGTVLVNSARNIGDVEKTTGLKEANKYSALNNCLNNPQYEMPEGFVFANCNVKKKGKVVYLPIYMIMFLENGDEQELILP